MSKDKKIEYQVDGNYQNKEMARRALYIRSVLEILVEETREFRALLIKDNPPKTVKEWIGRVLNNIERYFTPSVNNLDQIRYLLDRNDQGKGDLDS